MTVELFTRVNHGLQGGSAAVRARPLVYEKSNKLSSLNQASTVAVNNKPLKSKMRKLTLTLTMWPKEYSLFILNLKNSLRIMKSFRKEGIEL